MEHVALAVLRGALTLAGVVWASGLLAAPPPEGRPEAGTTPAALAAHIRQHPDQIPEIFRGFGARLMAGDADLERFLSAFTREHAKHERDVRVLVSLQLVDPQRFLNEPAFRARVLPMLPRALDASTPLDIRLAALRELNGPIGLTFDEAEKVAAGWGVVARTSEDRRIAFGSGVHMPDELSPIETSIFSLTSQFFTAEEAQTFVDAVRKAAPKRSVIALTDLPLENVTRVETFGREYTPWPRDPFSVGRDENGIVFVNRPNVQPGREQDASMVRALVQAAPFEARWAVAPVPFHNGHVLLTPDTAWISIHTVEIRTLELLGLKRVPVETFGTKDGVQAYLAGVRRAAKELEQLYQRKIQFVHPLEADPELFAKLGGGGGFDLDSLVTILPGPVALVGEISGRYAVPRAYGVDGKVLPATGLKTFLDVVAASLAARGMKVHRLPLMLVDAQPKPFLIGWHNVVLEPGRAEGFSSLIEEGDNLAREAFAKAGFELTLYPPLIESVVRGGGYRCASNHSRHGRLR